MVIYMVIYGMVIYRPSGEGLNLDPIEERNDSEERGT